MPAANEDSDPTAPRLVHLGAGEDVLEAIGAAALRGDAWVQATGVVESVQLRVSAGQPTLTLRGAHTLVSLSGRASGPVMALLARPPDAPEAGVHVVAGELLRGRCVEVALAVFPAAAPVPARAAAAGEPVPAKPSWSAIATATAEAETEDEPEAAQMPRYKDRVDHFKFGLCDVMTARGDRMKVREVHGSGRLREISLGVLKVLPPEIRDGKRIFKLVRRQKP